MFLNPRNYFLAHIPLSIPDEGKRQRKQSKKPRRLSVVWSEDQNENLQGIGSLYPKPNWVCSRKYLLKNGGIRTRFTACISPSLVVLPRAKAHKPYGFLNNIGLALISKSLVTTSIKGFEGNPHDSKTTGLLLTQLVSNGRKSAKEEVYDFGGREWSQFVITWKE